MMISESYPFPYSSTQPLSVKLTTDAFTSVTLGFLILYNQSFFESREKSSFCVRRGSLRWLIYSQASSVDTHLCTDTIACIPLRTSESTLPRAPNLVVLCAYLLRGLVSDRVATVSSESLSVDTVHDHNFPLPFSFVPMCFINEVVKAESFAKTLEVFFYLWRACRGT